ncbi:MAG: serine/threonine protein kinase, partial [Pirellulaceae bacterium]
MNTQLTDQSVLGDLVEEIFRQLEQGEDIDLDQLADEYPEYRDRLSRVLPMLRDLNALDLSSDDDPGFDDGLKTAEQRTLGDFRLLRQLGRGGMGVVYEAQQLTIDRRVAVKVLPFAALVDSKALQRFKNEVAAIATLEHPHIVSVYSVGEERGIHFYAMQLVRGQSLAAVIHELRQRARNQESITGELISEVVSDMQIEKGPFSNAETQTAGKTVTQQPRITDQTYFRNVVRLILQVTDALQHAHEHGIVHRDVKPGNLLLDTHGNLFVTDFGLARIETGAGLTMTGDVMGTLRYMSPEQVLANRVVIDHRTDIYSLGATVYELLTLQPIWPGSDKAELIRKISFEEPVQPRKVNASIPDDLETIVLKAISRNPSERYDTAKAMGEDLQRWLDHKPIVARRPTLVHRVSKWTRRNPAVMWSAIAILLVVIAALAFSNLYISGARATKAAALSRALDSEQQARQNFQRARDAVDDFLIKVSEETLLNEPTMAPLRKELLQLALDYFQEFAIQHSGDDELDAD